MKRISGSGARIKKLRTDLGLKQTDITSEKVSKSLICMIETNRRSLTYQTAVAIAEELNKHYGPLGKTITVEYLLETEEDRVKKDVYEKLDDIGKKVEMGKAEDKLLVEIEKLLEVIKKWHFDEAMLRLQKIRGDFYFNTYQYNEALGDYVSLLAEYIQIKDYTQIARMYIIIGKTYQMQMSIDTAMIYYIKAYETAVTYHTLNKESIKMQSLFNQILCYRKMKRYELALSHIELVKKLEYNDEYHKILGTQVILLEANTYRDIKEYPKAEKIYTKLLKRNEFLDKETQFLLYDNYAEFYRKQGEIPKALDYIEKAYSIKEGVQSNYIPALYLYKARCYNILEKYDQVLKLLQEGLKLAGGVSKNSIIIEIYFSFVDVYIKLKDYPMALEYLKKVDKIIADNEVKLKNQDLYSFYSDIYMWMGEKEKASEYHRKMRHNYLDF